MIVLSNTTVQTIPVGQAITFDSVQLHTGNGECHRTNSPSIKLRNCGVYEISFSGNVTGTAAETPVQLSMSLGGEILPETSMIYNPPSANLYGNVSKTTAIKNCCGDYDRITIVNTGEVPVILGIGSSLYIKRNS